MGWIGSLGLVEYRAPYGANKTTANLVFSLFIRFLFMSTLQNLRVSGVFGLSVMMEL